MDDIVRRVKGDPGIVLEAANKLHPNLQFTIEELDSEGNLSFLELNVNVDSGKKVTCGLYQKHTDTGTILIFINMERLWSVIEKKSETMD